MQKVWLKALRHLMAFAIEQDECKTDPTIGIKTARLPNSSGHVTWGNEQIAQYRERHANGTMARLAMELMLNIAARHHDAHLIGHQHLRMATQQDQPVHRQGSDNSAAAGATGRA